MYQKGSFFFKARGRTLSRPTLGQREQRQGHRRRSIDQVGFNETFYFSFSSATYNLHFSSPTFLHIVLNVFPKIIEMQ